MANTTPPQANDGALKINNGFESVENILNVEIPIRLAHKVKTGHNIFDGLLGGAEGGCDPGFVCLMTGVSGGGKSTLMVEVADHITEISDRNERTLGGNAIVNLTEQDITAVRKRVEQIGLHNGFNACAYTNVEELIEYADQYVEKPPKGTKAQDWLPRRETWLFIDSLFGMFVPRPEGQRGRDKGQQLMQEAVFKRLIEWAKENFVICFVLGHVNKAGKAAGKNSLIHLGDGHLHLGRKFDKETKESFLSAEMLKNRGGPTAIEYRYEATKSGITWQDEARGSTSCDIGGDDDE